MGLVIVALTASVRGYDALPDPVGWLLVVLGLRALRGAVPGWRWLAGLAVLAGVVSVVLWFPASQDLLDRLDPSLRWTANLPQLGFVVLLCHRLADLARDRGDAAAARWLRGAEVLAVVVAVLPVLVFGGGLTTLEETSYVMAGAGLLLVIWLLFAYARRSWATATATAPGPAVTEP